MVVSRHVACFVVVVPYTQEKKVPAKEQNRMVLAVKNVKHSPTQDIGAENENDGKNI